MTIEDLVGEAQKIAQKIETAQGETRVALHKDLHRLLEGIRVRGGAVPAKLRDLDHDLVEEEVEDMFDNMPV